MNLVVGQNYFEYGVMHNFSIPKTMAQVRLLLFTSITVARSEKGRHMLESLYT